MHFFALIFLVACQAGGQAHAPTPRSVRNEVAPCGTSSLCRFSEGKTQINFAWKDLERRVGREREGGLGRPSYWYA